MRETVPVLIVGGGPVGLSAAIGLRRWGVDCMLVERHPSTLDFPKGRGVSTRTMEIFREWGIEDEVSRLGLPRAETEFFYLGDTLLADEYERFDRTALGRSSSPSPTERLICAQDLVERALLRAAQAAGADLRFSTALVDLTQTEDTASAVVEDHISGERHVIAARYVAAADGSRSPLRDLLGVGTTGPGAIGDSVSILIEADLADRVADRLAIIYKVARPHPSAFFAVVDNDRRWLLMMSRDPKMEPPESFTDDRCLELVRAGLGDDTVGVKLLGHWFFQPTALVADRFRVGRVLLAGDAAHQTTPFGALGMNSGIADAHNLAWKLAGVLHGWAGAALLDSYEEERRPVAEASSEASILRADISKGPPRASFDGVTLGYAYDSPVIVPDGTAAPEVPDAVHDYVPTARPGHRAPHVWLERDGQRCSTLDLFGGGFTLLVDTDGRGVQASAESIVDELGVPFRQYMVGADGEVIDTDHEWRAIYEVGPGGCVLVRPDGHVAWRSAEPFERTADVVGAVRRAVGKD